MHELMTSLLDAFGLLLVAAGLGLAVAALIGPGPGLVVAGVVLLAGSQVAARMRGGRP
ncbi:MAG TPA: hypothetical protein VIQ30_14505 [Pseudonocardia sp.]